MAEREPLSGLYESQRNIQQHTSPSNRDRAILYDKVFALSTG